MARGFRLLILMLLAGAAAAAAIHACASDAPGTTRAFPAQKNAVQQFAPSEDVQRILSWLPADTESVFVANGPFSFPDLEPPDQPSPFTSASAEELKVDFEAEPLALVGFRNGVLAKRLIDQRVQIALEGSRHYRAPSGLGEALYEGCSIVIFERDVSDRTGAFLKDSLASDHPSEKIEGQSVTVFQEQLESDTWTILLAFPKPDTVLACSGRDYLREVLARMRGGEGAPGAHREVALPDSLPEWKYVDARSRFWAIRHFNKSQAAKDPTSPFAATKSPDGAAAASASAASTPAAASANAASGAVNSIAASSTPATSSKGDESLDAASASVPANPPDAQAIGLTFNFDPYKSWAATITYLSADPAMAAKLRSSAYFAPGDPAAAASLKIDLREAAPGAFALTYQLHDREAIHVFRLMLAAALGHAVYL
ncbi:MAG TPA: hypothetical protein VJR23_06375 [Candidatus Acidoferrales bacterium]|nr:hypothetical protein [Candidatus Acidoferrales bacterium]